MKRYFLVCFFSLSAIGLFSQAGSNVYEFLNLPYSSKMVTLGGHNVAIKDGDMNFAFHNPALLTPKVDKTIALNYTNLMREINYASVGYAQKITDKDILAGGIMYCDYGKFDKYTAQDYYDGEFTVKDIVFNILYTRVLNDYWNVGVNLKPIYSIYESYQSFALAADLGVNYTNEDIGLYIGFAARNLGCQIKGFYKDEGGQHYEKLPVNLSVGLSYAVPKAPLRFSVTYNNLERWNLTPQSTITKEESVIIGEEENTKKKEGIGGVGMFFRHTVFAVEIVPKSNKFYIGLSYNCRRQQEMSVSVKRAMSGLAFGAGVRIYKFDLGFSVAQYTISGWTFNLSLSTSLSRFNL